MSRFDADFSYAVADAVLTIWDLDLGNKSVTNDAENVLQKIEAAEGRSFAGSLIMYRDSMKFWDGIGWDGKDAGSPPFAKRPNKQPAPSCLERWPDE